VYVTRRFFATGRATSAVAAADLATTFEDRATVLWLAPGFFADLPWCDWEGAVLDAAKASAGTAKAAPMTTEAATDSAVLSAAPWITFSDESKSVFIGVLEGAAGFFRQCSKTTKN
jgi:hypothetical protein